MKSEVFVKDWNGTPRTQRLAVAEMWTPILRFELEQGHPRKHVVLGGNASEALRHPEHRRLIAPLPPCEKVAHYSYVVMRPDCTRSLPPGDPVRQRAWKDAVGSASRV
jgi:hypothetical protein